MREQTESILHLAAALALFLGACIHALAIQQTVELGIRNVAITTQEQHGGVATVDKVNQDETHTYKGSAVLFTLREVQVGRYDVLIDGIPFYAGSDPEQIDVSMIDGQANYYVNYERNAAGMVTRMMFIKVR
ncbi:hypothetical protein JCM10914A_41560 [Paenibacillus sp. JCM 10914]|uniref:hypothetical protein n=1 Tax=Paenibacillus sp. JCM 10914 TaxID=1236974 RepID=UPI0003CC50EA|nr:hypothetical protein [Paenibacillus sp. JCM 10914]GAE05371.1 hypothetical protein JCM10914_1469 [Paenibacillus sp. JCM 10914]